MENEFKFCQKCGKKVNIKEKKCIDCGFEFPPPPPPKEYKYCMNCGKKVEKTIMKCSECFYEFPPLPAKKEYKYCLNCGKKVEKIIAKCPECNYVFPTQKPPATNSQNLNTSATKNMFNAKDYLTKQKIYNLNIVCLVILFTAIIFNFFTLCFNYVDISAILLNSVERQAKNGYTIIGFNNAFDGLGAWLEIYTVIHIIVTMILIIIVIALLYRKNLKNFFVGIIFAICIALSFIYMINGLCAYFFSIDELGTLVDVKTGAIFPLVIQSILCGIWWGIKAYINKIG